MSLKRLRKPNTEMTATISTICSSLKCARIPAKSSSVTWLGCCAAANAKSSATRSAAAPNIPTIAESGLPGFEATSWFALMAPAGLPKEVLARINAETVRVLNLPDVREKLTTLGLDVAPGTPESLATLIQAETAKWAKVVKESGAKLD